MSAYYNEIEAYPAQWIRNLISAGIVAPGEVDERSINDLVAGDVDGARQSHFFAGIAVWSHALRCAGWPDEFPIWTGSCPCQPWSSAGGGGGFDDERHLWPAWFRLIVAARPIVVVGEQVASKDGLAWLDAVFSDLEGAGYSCRAVDFCAAGVSAPHIRQRLYFAAVLPDALRERGSRLFEAGSVGEVRPGGACREVDLRAVLESPYMAGTGHPQPLLRKVDDVPAAVVDQLRAIGNGLDAGAATVFLTALRESIQESIRPLRPPP